MQTLEHALALGIKLRINTVVNGNNVRELEKIAKTILKYQPKAVNFICFNDWVNAGKITGSIGVKYSEASPHIIAAIQTLYPYVPKVTVRYIPFCFMKGYEKHVCNLGQKDYDWDEWIDSIKRLVTDLSEDKRRTYTENINRIWEVHHEEIYPKLSVKEKKSVQRMQEGSLFNNFDCSLASVVHKIENHALRKSYIHGPQCKSCAYEKICDGVESSYAEHF
ncbi:MAG: hypothetical protein P8X55_12280 [Desulfosarcinaceae bacterium]